MLVLRSLTIEWCIIKRSFWKPNWKELMMMILDFGGNYFQHELLEDFVEGIEETHSLVITRTCPI